MHTGILYALSRTDQAPARTGCDWTHFRGDQFLTSYCCVASGEGGVLLRDGRSHLGRHHLLSFVNDLGVGTRTIIPRIALGAILFFFATHTSERCTLFSLSWVSPFFAEFCCLALARLLLKYCRFRRFVDFIGS